MVEPILSAEGRTLGDVREIFADLWRVGSPVHRWKSPGCCRNLTRSRPRAVFSDAASVMRRPQSQSRAPLSQPISNTSEYRRVVRLINRNATALAVFDAGTGMVLQQQTMDRYRGLDPLGVHRRFAGLLSVTVQESCSVGVRCCNNTVLHASCRSAARVKQRWISRRAIQVCIELPAKTASYRTSEGFCRSYIAAQRGGSGNCPAAKVQHRPAVSQCARPTHNERR